MDIRIVIAFQFIQPFAYCKNRKTISKFFICQNWKLEAIFKFIWTNMCEILVWRIDK